MPCVDGRLVLCAELTSHWLFFKTLFCAAAPTGTTTLGRFQISHASIQAAFILTIFKQDFKCAAPWRLVELLTEIDHRVGLWRRQHVTISHGMLGLQRGSIVIGGGAPCNQVFRAFKFMLDLDLSQSISTTDMEQIQHPFP